MPKPLLIVSDSISCTSGLGRIARDLAVRVHKHLPELYRVGAAGYGGPGSAKFSFPEYHFHDISNWMPPELPVIARDFAGDEELTLLVIWDLSRLGWMTDPRTAPQHIQRWLQTSKIRKWLYHPVDGEGPLDGMQSTPLAETMKGFDRVLDYTSFSNRVTGNTEFIPHGIDTSAWVPHDRREAKRSKAGFVGLSENCFLVGIVATNQARKDWALGIQTCRILLDRGHDVRVWCHVDTLERFWNLHNLVVDYGLMGRVFITVQNFTDEQMSWFYSACDVTLGIGLGEGMGFPIFESLACGTPVVHGDYAGAAEFLSPSMKVRPIAFRYEGPYCVRRPVFNPEDWADCAEQQKGITASLPAELDWNNLWSRWESWFRKGLTL